MINLLLIFSFQHLGFVHCPIREHCHAFPNCMDSLVERIVAKKSVANSGRPSSWAKANQGLDSNHLNLVVLGSDNLTGTLERQVKSLCNSDDEFSHQDEIFSLGGMSHYQKMPSERKISCLMVVFFIIFFENWEFVFLLK